MSYIKVSNIKLNIDASNDDAIDAALRKAGLESSDVSNVEIVKLSIDARKKPDIKKIYTVGFETDNKVSGKDITVLENKPEYKYEITGTNELKHRPVVVGFGPAGMFASYLLAINGYKPIIIERGGKVNSRVESVKKFWDTNELDTESNVQFGEGGAERPQTDQTERNTHFRIPFSFCIVIRISVVILSRRSASPSGAPTPGGVRPTPRNSRSDGASRRRSCTLRGTNRCCPKGA